MAKHDYTEPTLTVKVAIDTYLDADLTELYADLATLSAEAVKITGTQTVAGVKTFSSSPVVPTPTTDMQAATKKYIDDALGALTAIPSGLIAQWSGALADIPSGWNLCDGVSGRPNLLATFVMGVATASTEPGTTGGSKKITEANLPSHSHDDGTLATDTEAGHTHGDGSLSAAANGNHTHDYNGGGTTGSGGALDTNSYYPFSYETSSAGSHSHTVTGTTGLGGSHSHTVSGSTGDTGSGTDYVPPFYELAYIIKD